MYCMMYLDDISKLITIACWVRELWASEFCLFPIENVLGGQKVAPANTFSMGNGRNSMVRDSGRQQAIVIKFKISSKYLIQYILGENQHCWLISEQEVTSAENGLLVRYMVWVTSLDHTCEVSTCVTKFVVPKMVFTRKQQGYKIYKHLDYIEGTAIAEPHTSDCSLATVYDFLCDIAH